jgi:molybdenum cofactor cytidylyltransferase
VSPAGLILAAGESSRMGRDKALLSYAGTTFLEHLIGLFLSRVTPVVVVIGHHADAIRAAIPPLPNLQIVVNPNYQSGQLSSLQTGLRTITADDVLLTLVDHPAVAPATLQALLDHQDAPLVIPRYQNRRGHPILLSRPLIDEILALPPEATAKQVIHAHLTEAVLLDVDDPGILRDVDTPADYRSLLYP